MRIYDRYVLLAFLKNYVLTLVVLIGLYITLDMVLNFDEFAVDDADGSRGVLGVVRAIASYYGVQSLLIFTQLAGVVPVIAAAFTLMRLSRFNELTALLAAGVPLLRVAVPIGVAAVVLTLFTLVGHELIIPRFTADLLRERDEAGAATLESFPIEGLPVDRTEVGGRLLYAGRYFPGDEPRMLELTLIEHDADFTPTRMTTARAATWDEPAGHWDLEGGLVEPVSVRAAPEPAEPIGDLRLGLEPRLIQLLQSKDYVELLPLARINDLLAQEGRVRVGSLLQVKHGRLAGIVVNVVLVLLVIPCVLTREPGQLKRSAFLTLGLVGSCLGSIFLCQTLAGQVPPATVSPAVAERWPALMAWLPVFLYGPLAVALLDRVKT